MHQKSRDFLSILAEYVRRMEIEIFSHVYTHLHLMQSGRRRVMNLFLDTNFFTRRDSLRETPHIHTTTQRRGDWVESIAI